MAAIQSIGVGSGVLTSDLIDQLVEVEKAPTEKRLDAKQEEFEAELSAFGQIKNAITDLRLPMRILSNPTAINEKTISSTSSAITASASASSPVGTYAIKVDQLALAHSLVSPASASYASPDDVVGTGSMIFLFGTTSYDEPTDAYTGFLPNPDKGLKSITIDSSNNTLEGIKKTINEADFGVQASIINDGNGYRLLISSADTGEDNSIQIIVSDADGVHNDTAGLSAFAFNSSATNMIQTQEGQNALMQLNGITIERESNQVSEIIEGVTLKLTETTTGPVTLSITQDTEKVVERVKDFIDKYNIVKDLINEYTDYDEATQQGALLMGDSTLRNVERQLQAMISAIVPGLENSAIRSLPEIGISTNRENGNLTLNETKLRDAILDHPDDVSALFSRAGNTSDALIKYGSHSSTTTQPGTYDIEITQIATRASLTSAAVTNFTIDSNNDAFTIKFENDNAKEYSIILDAGTYTGAQLALEIQAKINTAANSSLSEVSFDGTNLVINQSKYGANAAIEITAIDFNSADLGLSIATGTAGVNVEGTINGQTATGTGQSLKLNKEGDPANGIAITVVGGAIGPRGDVSIVKGFADQMVTKLNDFLAFNGTFTNKTNTLSENLSEIQRQRDDLADRIINFRRRLEKQFTAADLLVNRLDTTRDYVKQQLDAIMNTTIGKK